MTSLEVSLSEALLVAGAALGADDGLIFLVGVDLGFGLKPGDELPMHVVDRPLVGVLQGPALGHAPRDCGAADHDATEQFAVLVEIGVGQAGTRFHGVVEHLRDLLRALIGFLLLVCQGDGAEGHRQREGGQGNKQNLLHGTLLEVGGWN